MEAQTKARAMRGIALAVMIGSVAIIWGGGVSWLGHVQSNQDAGIEATTASAEEGTVLVHANGIALTVPACTDAYEVRDAYLSAVSVARAKIASGDDGLPSSTIWEKASSLPGSAVIAANANTIRFSRPGGLEVLYGTPGVEGIPFDVRPGNLVSVAGDLLEEGAGEPFHLVSNGIDQNELGLDAYLARDGDVLEISNGNDVTEASKSEEHAVQPALSFDGDALPSIGYVKQWGREGSSITVTGEVSGQSVEIPGKPVQDAVVSWRDPVPADGRKLVALTFDGGPSASFTQRVLDVLKAADARATFYGTGEAIRANPVLVRAILSGGSELSTIGETFSQLDSYPEGEFRALLAGGLDSVAAANGTPAMARPTTHAFSAEDWLWSQGRVSVLARWTADSGDYDGRDANAVEAAAMEGVHPGSIIRFHDGDGMTTDAMLEALPRIVSRLQADGYSLVTVSELIASDPGFPEWCTDTGAVLDDAVWGAFIV